MTALIGLDWGTSNCRAFRIARDGAVLETRAAAQGILAVKNGDFAAAYEALIGDWLKAHAVPVLMCGMIGSRQGWVEAPYVDLPAGAAQLACALAKVPGQLAAIVPGLVGDALAGGRDVIRGEETQIVGALDPQEHDALYCLPGTHSKWVKVEGGRMVRFATFMTGEVYGVLRQHSILGRLMESETHDDRAFSAGIERGRSPGGLLHQIFSVRTEGLFGAMTPAALPSYLSGLLIGHELRAALAAFPAARIVLVGAPALTERYRAAIDREGRASATVAGEGAAAKGLWRIAEKAGYFTS
ncbi:MAG TPA: 2-dehydro-3-deoxygalactonokinase [Alphaproteobacteria bacterium]|nr:2-dehydro-3-deoxygalactonokinase [Alphaproteobacteria bacterium]